MRYLSLFSGIEAATVAWKPLGWKCVAVSEVEKFPCAVLKHHYPDVSNLGDVTQITEEQIAALGPIDLIVGGFPCQDVSVAGLRTGFFDADGNKTRSGLFYDAMRIVRWARANNGLRYVLIENVPGLFSSNGGRDFADVVGSLVGAGFDVPTGGWQNFGVATGGGGMAEWRVLDAQHFGVPQRRRRVFIVADFGNWKDRPPILLERDSLQRHSPARRETGQETPGCSAIGIDEEGNATIDGFVPLLRGGQGGVRQSVFDMRGGGDGNLVNSLTGDHASRPTDYTPIVMAHGQGGAEIAIDASPNLTCNHEAPIVAFQPQASSSQTMSIAPVCPTIGATKCPAVAFAQNTRDEVRLTGGNLVGCISAQPGMKQQTYLYDGDATLRRITPTEAERLQGFPVGYTRIPWRGKRDEVCPDGPRYKALGNSFAVPVVRWIGERIMSAATREGRGGEAR